MADSALSDCQYCGGNGSVRVHGAQDYGVSFESELCDRCDYGRSLIAADMCIWEGHEWAPAGGGVLICMRCQDEKDEDVPEAKPSPPRTDSHGDAMPDAFSDFWKG